MSLFKAKLTPASISWRAFFFFLALFTGLALEAQAQTGKRYRPQPDYVQISKPDQAEGRRLMEEFRLLGIPGDYYLEFQLRMMPRRGDETLYTGQLWGGRFKSGSWSRIVLKGADGSETRLLIHGGTAPSLWTWTPGAQSVQRSNTADLFKPMGNTLLTPFDLQMPYLYWSDFVYEGLAKVRDRPSHRFLLYPPGDIAVAKPSLFGVRISIDTQFKAMVESIQVGEGDHALKTLALVELKKTQEQWIVRTIDVRDEESRSKTRLTVTAAALGLGFSDVLGDPESLADNVQAPNSSRLDKF